jgi:hypothetical protein
MPRSATSSLLCAHAALVLLLWFIVAAAAACNGDDDDASASGDAGGGECSDPLPLDCRPSFEPASFDTIFDNVLRPSCGSSASGTQCHSAAGMQAGLVLGDRTAAYDTLLRADEGPARVVPGKPECSMLIQRLEASDPRVRMPLNSPALSEGLRCAIRLWVAEGAER